MNNSLKALAVFSFLALTFAFQSTAQAGNSDPCRGVALAAAEDAYGNDPMKTYVYTVRKGREYSVTVGKGNVEDGEHTYSVIFTKGCGPGAPKPRVRDLSCPQCR